MTGDPDQGPSVRNLQRRHRVDARGLRAFLVDIAETLGVARPALTVALVGDERMQRLNADFRGYDKPTDVLSFPVGDEAGGAPSGDPYLGDIVISVTTAERQAERRGSHLERELRVLTLHGFLHLLGYDHETDEGQMRRVEYRLRRRFGITTPRGAT